jgi:N-acetylmuramoyl-L-alanine amidase
LKRFAGIGVVLFCVLLTAGYMQARVHRPQSWAQIQFDKAESQRQTLDARSDQSRTRREYETAIASYRRVVLEAPTSTKADDSAFGVAEITAEMGRHFKDDIALYSAIREYKYLRREYPASKHRIAALLAIGKIYRSDLGDDPDGREALEELLRRYPHSQSAAQARAELGAPVVPASSKNSEAEKKSVKRDSAPEKTRNSNSDDPTPTVSSRTTSTNPSANNDSGEEIRVTAVQHWSGPDYTRITVDLEQDVQFESQHIDHPERIFFDLKNARLSSDLIGKSFNVDDGLVKRVRVAQYKPGRARIVIETADRAEYTASLLLNPPRLIIDVHNSNSAPNQAQSADCAGGDARASTKRGFRGAGVPAHADAASQPPCAPTDALDALKMVPAVAKSAPLVGTGRVKRVIVEADDEDTADTPDPALSSSARSAKSPLANGAKTKTKTGRVTSARSLREAQPTSNGDRSLIRALGLKIGKIVIDPGHGGHDTGTIGPNGLLEKDLVLDVSRRLGKLLEARLGAEVVFTRRDDTFIPLETRTSIANQEQADLFVSVHANSSHDPDARGVETYYLNFTSSPEALDVAARENAASDKDIHELQDLVKKIALKEKIEESREFASDVQQSLHSGLAAKTSGVRDRGVKKAPFVVLIGANMPSILAEISYISNPGDEKRLKSPDYRQRIAESLYRGISHYVNGLGGVKVASKIEKASAE